MIFIQKAIVTKRNDGALDAIVVVFLVSFSRKRFIEIERKERERERERERAIIKDQTHQRQDEKTYLDQ